MYLNEQTCRPAENYGPGKDPSANRIVSLFMMFPKPVIIDQKMKTHCYKIEQSVDIARFFLMKQKEKATEPAGWLARYCNARTAKTSSAKT